MRRKAMYEMPSQRKSVNDALSIERFVNVRMKILVCRESAGVLRIARMKINKTIVAERIQGERRDSQLTNGIRIPRTITKIRKRLSRGGGAEVRIGSGRK